ncbi:MAG: SDR family NAD(P)-dependent oxidoreductase, partial [Acidobacteriota bacterium]
MLELSMDLEADLGIDSIKRVEILAAFQDRVPDLPEIDPAPLGTLKTLGAIVDHMRELSGSGPAAATAAEPAAEPAPAALDLEALMLEVVAEKTGYPPEMLELSMDLEADLGIDSIKRVEILAAFQDRVPDLPEIDPGPLGTLKTLGAIVDHMRALSGAPEAPTQKSEAPQSEPAEPEVPEAEAAPSLARSSRYALEAVPAPALGLALPGLLGETEPVLVQGGPRALAEALVEALGERGVAAERAERVPEGARAAIYLGALSEASDEEAEMAVNLEAFQAARALAPRLGGEGGGLFVTVQDTGGRFGVPENGGEAAAAGSAWSAGLPALIKTAAQEWPHAALRAIDLERSGRSPEALASALRDELLEGGGDELEIGLGADGVRRTLRSFEAPVERGESAAIEPGDVVVVSGGARGVTAASIIAWAGECLGRFVLLGRTELSDEPAACAGVEDDAGLKRALLEDAKARGGGLPSPAELGSRVRAILGNREIRQTLAAIERAGGEARYLPVDVTDAAALSAALEEVRAEWGPIAGLVHGAGVLADRFIHDLTDAQFLKVFNTKVGGLRALLNATSGDSLKVLCFFSSVAARCGNRGQAAYAMANEVLNKVASQERGRRPRALVKSLGWGPWDGGMVSPELKKHFAALGVPMISLEEGGAMLSAELHGAQPAQVELVLGGEPKAEALLGAEGEPGTLRRHLVVNRASHGHLAGHAIAGTPVVPVVQAVEWLTRMAQAHGFGAGGSVEIAGLKVLRGIRLEDFAGEGALLTLTGREAPGGELTVEILGADGLPHYRAVARKASSGEPAAAPDLENGAALEGWDERAIYDGEVLFHGEEFQVLEEIEGLSETGAKARLHGLAGRPGWADGPWQIDVALLDGGLQLAVLWAQRVLGSATLPTSIASVRTFADAPAPGALRCVVEAVETRASRAVSNVVFTGAGGRRVAELVGVETHLRPDLVASRPSAEPADDRVIH